MAKHRIASGEHPNWIAAWLPVVADGAVLFAILFALFPAVSRMLEGLAIGWVLAAFFLVYFIPTQIVLILSALWAAKSRHTHDEPGQPPE